MLGSSLDIAVSLALLEVEEFLIAAIDRPHGALNWNTPAATLNQLHKDNLPAEHT